MIVAAGDADGRPLDNVFCKRLHRSVKPLVREHPSPTSTRHSACWAQLHRNRIDRSLFLA